MPFVKIDDPWAVTYEQPCLEPMGPNQFNVYTYLEWCLKDAERMGEGFYVVENTNDDGVECCYIRRKPPVRRRYSAEDK